MSRPRVSLLAILALAACSPPGSDEAAAPREPPSPDEAVSPVANTPTPSPSLVGEYRVAGIDGEPLDAPIGIAVSIDMDTIELAPCAGLLWTYAYAEGSIETLRAPPPEGGIVCRITLGVQDVGEAIDAATTVRRTTANGLEFSGGGHSVLLFSQ